MKGYSKEPKTRKNVLREKMFEHCYENRAKCCKNWIQKEVHKTAEATGELIGDKIAEKIVKANCVPDVNSRNVETFTK